MEKYYQKNLAIIIKWIEWKNIIKKNLIFLLLNGLNGNFSNWEGAVSIQKLKVVFLWYCVKIKYKIFIIEWKKLIENAVSTEIEVFSVKSAH